MAAWRPMKTENNYTTFIDHLLAEKKERKKKSYILEEIFF